MKQLKLAAFVCLIIVCAIVTLPWAIAEVLSQPDLWD